MKWTRSPQEANKTIRGIKIYTKEKQFIETKTSAINQKKTTPQHKALRH